ncbi:hypothetical protein [Salinicola acroporae]|nr:hypothetical protein [Salinicola acroporae]
MSTSFNWNQVSYLPDRRVAIAGSVIARQRDQASIGAQAEKT